MQNTFRSPSAELHASANVRLSLWNDRERVHHHFENVAAQIKPQ